MKPLLLLTMAVLSSSPVVAAAGYLFTTFKGEETPLSEQIYFGLSRDGREWEALNGGAPVLVSKLGERGVRDPFILRSHDGQKVYLIATDLSIHLNRNWGRAVSAGSRSILVWESEDLVNWSEPRLVAVAADDAGCTWAPEAVYDEEAGDYLVFWASQNRRDQFARHRIWACHTKDFITFGKPFIYIDRGGTVIDTTIIRENGRYYRFSKDEEHKAITMEVGEKLAGPWHEVPNFSLARMRGFEGPACFPLEPATPGHPGTWCLLIDHYARGAGYKPFVTGDLASGQFTPAAANFKFPFHFRHGGVLALTAEEYTRLQTTYGHGRPATPTPTPTPTPETPSVADSSPPK